MAKLINDQQTQELENKEDIYSAGQDVDSVIKLHELNSTNTFDFNTEYFPPTEPDLDKNTLWLQGYNMGNTVRDLSGFDYDITLAGDPILINGTPFDYGIHTGGCKSTALRFNRIDGAGVDHSDSDENVDFPEYIDINDSSRIQIDGSSSISYFFRVRPLATTTNGGKLRTIYCKTDTEGANVNGEVTDAVRFCIHNDNKSLVIMIKRNGTFVCKETAVDSFVVNRVYDVFITYNSGTIKCYLAKITSSGVADSTPTDMTLTNSAVTEEWGDNLSDLSARLMVRGPAANDGAFRGDLFDFKIYRNYTVSAAEAGYHWTNKWTIADIPYGQVAVSNYYGIYNDITAGYDPIGYDSTGYDTV